MKVSQIYEVMNDVTNEILGKTDVILEDLSNIVDVGSQIFDATSTDHYVQSLVNQVGRMIFVNRQYSGRVPSVLMDGWEFGSILEKIACDIPEASENESWELTNGTSYDPNIFYQPKAYAKFFNKRVTFEVPMSYTDKQVKESFQNAVQLNAFISMVYSSVEKSMTIKLDKLVMMTINNMIAETVHADMPDGDYTQAGGVKAINLLKRYNEKHGTELTAELALENTDFLKFAAYQIGIYRSRMSSISTLFNIGKKERFTPEDLMHIVLLTDFKQAADNYLQSIVFHEEYTKLPNADEIPYWQGTGQDYSFASVSKIDVKTSEGNTVSLSGVIGVIFDRDTLGVTNMDRRVTSNYNPKAEFTTNFTKMDAGYFNDMNENFVVFYMA